MLEETRAVVAVDVGGTFTDCVAWNGVGVEVLKLATSLDQSRAVIEGTAELAGEGRFERLLHGTTVATNALLERKGADTVLVTDEGFEDVIEIGRQDRPSLYDSFSDRPMPLVSRSDRFGLGSDLAAVAERVKARSPESVAVALAYSFRQPDGEKAVAAALETIGVPVSLSHEVAGEFREFERTSTTVLNAYLAPRVAGYLAGLAEVSATVADGIAVMRSSGGLIDARQAVELPVSILLSGPAGGVVAAAALGNRHGYGRVIAFDMGGTSTDVCRIEDGRVEMAYERSIDGYPCRMPSVAVHTVGAGGGSVAWIDAGGSLRVGPHSAGADPGPAAYGRGGAEPTVTDAHVHLRRIDPGAVLGGRLALHPYAAESALATLGERLGLDPYEVSQGILEVVEARMERAIRAVSVEQGADPRSATLVAYGGAGGLHATALARRLGMARVAVPPHGGVFSALGLLLAPPRLDMSRSIDGTTVDPVAMSRALAAECEVSFVESHLGESATIGSLLDVRYLGQAHEMTISLYPGEGLADVEERFHAAHAVAYGFSRPEDPVEIVTLRAVATATPALGWDDLPTLVEGPLPPHRRRLVGWDGGAVEAKVWDRVDLPAAGVVEGPAVVEETVGTIFLAPGELGTVESDGTLVITW